MNRSKWIKNFTVTVIIIWFINFILAIGLTFIRESSIQEFNLDSANNVLIFAAHQDDAVIQAGGLAIRNINLGGSVNVVYLTTPANIEDAQIRKTEANNAWRLLGDSNVNLVFFDYISGNKNWNMTRKHEAKNRIISIIKQKLPDIIIIPLKERGHFEHDLLNHLVRSAIKENKIFSSIELLQAAEYNPYYIMGNTPSKMLWFLVRLLPFIKYKDPNFGLIPENQKRFKMTQDDLSMKIRMLAKFESQRDIIPEYQFGYPDLFDSTEYLPFNNFIRIGKKFLSIWSAFTLFITITAFFCIGANISVLCVTRTKFVKIFSFLSLLLLIGINFKFPKMCLDDSIYIVFIFSGIFFGAYFVKIQ